MLQRFASCIIFVAIATFSVFAGPVSAEQLKFTATSAHPETVELEFRSQTRPGHSWPGPGRIYKLDDDEAHALPISCQSGEQICYGAWVKGDYSVFWGVGHANSHRCTSCCYRCDGTSHKISLTN